MFALSVQICCVKDWPIKHRCINAPTAMARNRPTTLKVETRECESVYKSLSDLTFSLLVGLDRKSLFGPIMLFWVCSLLGNCLGINYRPLLRKRMLMGLSLALWRKSTTFVTPVTPQEQRTLGVLRENGNYNLLKRKTRGWMKTASQDPKCFNCENFSSKWGCFRILTSTGQNHSNSC